MPKSWDNVSFGNESRVKISELIKIVDYRTNLKFKQYRFIGDLTPYAVIWLPIYKDGAPLKNAKGNEVRIPFNVTNFDVETGEFDTSKKCPFVEAAEKMAEHVKDDKERKQFSVNQGYYGLAINRKLQDNPDKDGRPSKTERSTGFKDSLDSDSFTPVEVHQINYTIGQGIDSCRELNTKTDKSTGEKVPVSIADPKYGCDIMIKFDPKAQGQGKYKVQKAERTPITDEEKKLLLWDVASAIKETTIPRKDAKIEAARILEEFMKSVKKSKSKRKSNDSPDIDDEDIPEDIEEELDSKKKKSSKKKNESPDEEDDSKSSKKKPTVDEDESPVVSKKKSSKKKEESPDEDEEDDEDEIDLDSDIDDDD